MAFKTIKPLDLPSHTDLAQTLDAVIQQVTQATSHGAEAPVVVPVSPEELNKTIAALLRSSQDNMAYNSVTDQRDYIVAGRPIDADQARALKTSNRMRALEQQAELKNLRESHRRILKSTDHSAHYSRTEHPGVVDLFVRIWGGDADNETITSVQYADLKDLEQHVVAQEAAAVAAGPYVNTPVTRELDWGSWSWGRGDDGEKYDSPPGITNIPENIDVGILTESIGLYEDHMADVPSDGVSLGAVFSASYTNVLDTESINRTVVSTLGKIDENTSYIDSVFGASSIDIESGGRPEHFDVTKIWENCFDCFAGAWNGDIDFKFNLGIEIRLKGLLDVVDDLLKSLKMAVDLPAIITSNMCSLMKLGMLCPIEIAFLIASLVALLRFCWTEVIKGIGGFLAQLAAAIIMPLFGALEAIGDVAIGPFNVYTGCVMKTILSTEQVEWTGAWTLKQIGEVITGSATTPTQGDNMQIAWPVRAMWTGLKDPALQDQILNPRPSQISAQAVAVPILSLLKHPDLIGLLDPIEYIKSALEETSSKLGDTYRWIKNALAGLKLWVQGNLVNRTLVTAKIIAISTLLGVLIAISRILFTDVDATICQKEKQEDGTIKVVPKVDPVEFARKLNLPSFLVVQDTEGTPLPDSDSIDGETVPSGNPANPNDPSSPGRAVIVNTATNSMFALISCDKSKSRNVSRTELQSVLRELNIPG